MNIIEAIEDPALFRPFLGELKTWEPWLTALKALYGLPIKGKKARELIRTCTGRDSAKLPSTGFNTALLLTGRRSGKSRTAAVVAAFEAILAGRESKLAKGEQGVVVICAPTRSQSRIVKGYLRGVFDVPILRKEIANETQSGFELVNGTRIEILAGDWKTVRGFTLLCAVVDEAAFFGYDTESKVKSDTELIRAIQPSLATVGGKLIAISSPYAPKGWCYSQYKRYFGNDAGKVLVWNSPSRTMNSTLPQSIIDEAMAEDLASAKAEYLGEFRTDVCAFIPREMIEALVVKGRIELMPEKSRRYSAFCDLSGGRVDDAGLAIAHLEGKKVVLDYLRRFKPPFNPNHVIAEMVIDLQRYRLERVVGDNYSAEFVKSAFETRGVRYARASSNPWSKNPTNKVMKPASQLYLELLPRLCSGEIELLDNEMLVNQLAALERKVRSGMRDLISHPTGQHDDLANCVAGVADCVVQRKVKVRSMLQDDDDRPMTPMQRAMERSRREMERDRIEHETMRRPVDDMTELRNFMRRVGRI